MEGDPLDLAVRYYQSAHTCVVARGFSAELEWCRSRSVDKVTESEFLREAAWCILNSGMRETVVRQLFPSIGACFWQFESATRILRTENTCVSLARRYFNHEGKVRAIAQCAHLVERSGGFEAVRGELLRDPLALCQRLPYIGPVTVWHLARNLGVDCAKPDRHLTRLTQQLGYRDALAMCEALADVVGERIGVVDIVLWRHAALGCTCASPAGGAARRRTSSAACGDATQPGGAERGPDA